VTVTPDPADPTRPAADADDAGTTQRGKGEGKKRSALREGAILVGIAVFIYYVMLTFIARPYLIPSESMQPTLNGCKGCVGDRIMVDKLTYRFSTGTTNNPKFQAYTSTGSLIQLRNQYKNYRDFSILALSAAYGLQVIDAVVDAHLSGFDMNQPLSLNMGLQPSGTAGFGISFRIGQ